MDIKQLNEFRVLAEICNFQEAAEELYISLSSLSKHISKLEEELGVSLFDRTTRKVTLTEYGTVVYDYAKQIVNSYNDCTRALKDLKQDHSLRLSVSFPPILTQYRLLEALIDFMHKNPDIEVTMTEHINPRELLQAKKCDVAFHTEYGEMHTENSSLYMEADTLVAVLPASHPLAGEEFIRIDQLKDEKFIIKHDTSSVLSRILIKLCNEAGFEPKIAHTVKYSSAMVRMVSEGLGVAVMNYSHIPDSEKYKIGIVEIQPIVPFNIYLLYSNERRNSAALKAFRNYFSETMKYSRTPDSPPPRPSEN